MGISKTQVTDITDTQAKVTWETDMDATTELRLWQKNSSGGYDPVDIGTVTGQGNTDVTINHIFNLVNLIPETTYKVEARSYNEISGDYMVCDDGSTPREFTTLVAQQQVVGSVSVTAAKQRITVGESTDIIAKVFDSNSAAMQGVSVDFYATGAFSWLFFWLPPIGTVNPQSTQTNVSGEAKTVFTASRKGIAVIKAKAGSVSDKVVVTII